MYRRLPQSEGNVLGYEVSGGITEDDLDEVATELQEVVDDYGAVSVLVRAPDGQEIAGTLGDRLRLLKEDIGEVERYALVTDARSAEWVGTIADQVTPVPLQHFESAREQEAWRWLAGVS